MICMQVPWLVPDLLDPYFVSKPSEIFQHFLILSCFKSKLGAVNGWFNGDFAKCMARNENNTGITTAITLKDTLCGMLAGVSSGFVVGLILGRSDRVSAICMTLTLSILSLVMVVEALVI